MKVSFILLLFMIPVLSLGQLVKIKGYAPDYIGSEVNLYIYEDLITNTEVRIASSTVNADSTFTVNFFFSGTERTKLKVGNNFAFLYIQPGGEYEIYFPSTNKYEAVHPQGSEMEILFRTLPKSDINFKILEFDRWLGEFLGEFYHVKGLQKSTFGQQLDTLKMNMEQHYKEDTSVFFKTTVMFRLAELDEASYYGSRNELEKFDHYLFNHPVMFKNDAYMDYIKKFYKDFFERTTMEINNRIYLAVLKSSPTLMFNALGADYRMKNLRLREMIMIKGLGEIYYNNDYPQTNIAVMLDSLSKHALFDHNKIIATNLSKKLTDLLPGSPSPRFTLNNLENEEFGIHKFPGKYKYIQFIHSTSVIGKNEMELMKPMYTKYGQYVEFITLFMDDVDNSILVELKENNGIKWTLATPKNSADLTQQFNLRTFPHYTLIDPDGFIVGSPAQRPTPDGQYETIDKTFYEIHKVMMSLPE